MQDLTLAYTPPYNDLQDYKHVRRGLIKDLHKKRPTSHQRMVQTSIILSVLDQLDVYNSQTANKRFSRRNQGCRARSSSPFDPLKSNLNGGVKFLEPLQYTAKPCTDPIPEDNADKGQYMLL